MSSRLNQISDQLNKRLEAQLPGGLSSCSRELASVFKDGSDYGLNISAPDSSSERSGILGVGLSCFQTFAEIIMSSLFS